MSKLKQPLILLLSLMIIFPSLPNFSTASAIGTEPIMQIKLRNYLGDRSEITIVPIINYSTNIPGVNLTAKQAYTLKIKEGKIQILKGTIEVGKATSINITPINGKGAIEIESRPYLGTFSFIMEENKYIRPINTIGMEDYLKGVVPAEMPALWPMEALKAQTVSARTYALCYASKLINDTQSFQVYGGYIWHERTSNAVNDTIGQVITYDGNSIGSGALFSSSNGGVTESNVNAWGNHPVPYLTIKKDPYDPKTIWSFQIKKTQINTDDLDFSKTDTWWATTHEADRTGVITNIKKWFKENGYAGKDIKIAAIPQLTFYGETSGGRISKGSITVDLLVKDDSSVHLQRFELKDVTAAKIRSIIGLNIMKSYLVSAIETTTDTTKVSGAGYGHGVGLSQYGAKNAAEAGKSYKDILSFYYDKTRVSTIYQTPAESAPTDSKPIATKDTKAPTIKNIRTTYDQKNQQVKIRFSINEKAKVRVYIRDKKGKITSYPLKKKLKSAGTQTTVWNASKNDSGQYKVVVSVEDLSKNSRWTSVSYTLKKPALTGKVKATMLNIRSKASMSGKVLGTAKKNAKVTILHKSGSWYKIKHGKVTGYVSAKYITVVK